MTLTQAQLGTHPTLQLSGSQTHDHDAPQSGNVCAGQGHMQQPREHEVYDC